ncbi:alpha/beta hydrolase family protein [Flexithrix dorotheae]|uniref:alpha/beta hydrolase family protein n=1 Tax=Flexithrix dorotheae TaxID=70993 RepID=UPI0003622AC4|nr:alpha/beta fold hydrolase [Flexithrix dorotheae]
MISALSQKEIQVLAQDGFELGAKTFLPEDSKEVVFLISSATGVKQNYYEHFAQWLAEKGYQTFTFDYRGIGKSKPGSLKGFEAYMQDWGKLDLEGMIRHIKQEFPNKKLLVIGHSVGGQLFGLTPACQMADGFVGVGSQMGYWKLWPVSHWPKLLFFWKCLIPVMNPIFGFFPAKKLGLFEDLPKGVAAQWQQWGTSPDYLFKYLPEEKENYEKIRKPFLAVSFSDDEFAPKKAVDRLVGFYANADMKHIHLTPDSVGVKRLGHFAFFRKKYENRLWPMVLEWATEKGFLY